MSATWLDLQEACEYLKISAPTLYRLIKQRKIAYSKIGTGRGTYRFKQEDLEAYLEQNRVEPQSEMRESNHTEGRK